MANDTLIRSGLPWSSPLKIMVDSSEIINDMTINRGLLNLLNNDYYLDLKTQALNNFIENNISQHINDTSIHFTLDSIQKLIGSSTFLHKNTCIKIPVKYSQNDSILKTNVRKINQLINLLPKHLNGNILLVQFVYSSYSSDSSNSNNEESTTDINCNDICIHFNGFSNGTLIITSNTSSEAAISECIDNITNIDTLTTDSSYLSQRLSNIISGLTYPQKFDNNGFTFIGNGINQYYSVFSIIDSNADIYLFNCNIKNSLSGFTTDEINRIKEQISTFKLPSTSDILCLFFANSISKDKLITSDSTTLDTTVFSNNVDLYVNSEKNTSQLLEQMSGITWLQLNKTVNQIPDYLTFTNKDNTFEYDWILREYMYNWNNNNKNFSICFWADPNILSNNKQFIPIISDFKASNDSEQKNFGMYTYANFLYSTTMSNITQNNMGYAANMLTYNINNKEVFFVVDFLTTSSYINDRSCYKTNSKWNLVINKIYGTDQHDVSYNNPLTGYMHINITAYDINSNEYIFIPNESDAELLSTYYDSNKSESLDPSQLISLFFRQNNYEFKIPKREDYPNNQQYQLKFFANKILQDNNLNISNWNYFTGKIRNIIFFKKILSQAQIDALLKADVTTTYYFNNELEKSIVDNITISSYIGALSVYNSSKVNIVKNKITTVCK